VTVTGQEGWESAKNIKSFNGNIYLLSNDGKTLYKHKPGVNGFSNKSIVLENTDSWMVEVAIDGGYILWQKTDKYEDIFHENQMHQRK